MRDTNQTTSAATIPVNDFSAIVASGREIIFGIELFINNKLYQFDAATDLVHMQKDPGNVIAFQRKEENVYGWISFKNNQCHHAGSIEVYDHTEKKYLLLYESAGNMYPVTLLEQNNKEKILSGYFKGTYTNAYDEPVFQVICRFRLQR
ncbi:MAG: hypothetical protein JST81_15905 [Bacteroidetes bacterium]|nr:hypothetical protein [Bacteroidota bacterium]